MVVQVENIRQLGGDGQRAGGGGGQGGERLSQDALGRAKSILLKLNLTSLFKMGIF